MAQIITNSSSETIKLGQSFSSLLNPADVVLLEGDLGGGKTTFVKGILLGLNYKKNVLSPTFTLIREYQTKRLIVYHADLYRLGDSDYQDLGLWEYFYSTSGVTLVEWGEKIEKLLPRYIKIKFDFLDDNHRKITLSTKGIDVNRKNAFIARNVL